MSIIEFINLKLAVLTVLSQIFILCVAVFLLFFKKKHIFIIKFLAKYGLLFSFIVALTATLGSLFYSEIAGYIPCTLCWYQRIFMYPQIIILGLALIKKDQKIFNYSLALSAIGLIIALYHYLMQLGVVSGLSCSLVGYSVSCVKQFVMQFGYITIPLMSLTAFSLIVIFL